MRQLLQRPTSIDNGTGAVHYSAELITTGKWIERKTPVAY